MGGNTATGWITGGSWAWANTSSSTTGTGSYTTNPGYVVWNDTDWTESTNKAIAAIARVIKAGDVRELPDGSTLIVDDLGNYRIEDKDAKVTYQANRIREWSPHLNASDMVAKFVEYVGTLGVRQSEVLNLPLELFINWLIISAAERDKDPIPDDVIPVERHQRIVEVRRPRCLYCQRFISIKSMERRFQFCDLDHGGRYLQRLHVGNQRLLEAPRV